MAETIDFKIGKVPTLRLPEDGNFAITFAFTGIDLTGYDATLTAQNGQSNLRTPLFWSLSGLTVSAAEIAFDVAQSDEDDTDQAFSLVTSSGFTDYALTVYDAGIIVMRLQGDIEWIERVGSFDTATPASNEIEVIVDDSTAVTVEVTGGGGGGGGISVLDTNTPTSGLTGILKAASNTLDVAVAGTDYLAPNGDGSALTGLFNPAAPGPIGGTTPAAGTFTAIGADGSDALNSFAVPTIRTGSRQTGLASMGDWGLCLIVDGQLLGIFDDRGVKAFEVFGKMAATTLVLGNYVLDPSLTGVSPSVIQQGYDATSPADQTLKAPNATGDNNDGASLTISGGNPHGSGTRGDVILNGGNRAAFVADATDEASAITLVNALKQALIDHGLMSPS